MSYLYLRDLVSTDRAKRGPTDPQRLKSSGTPDETPCPPRLRDVPFPVPSAPSVTSGSAGRR
jgi:hypothetical protein